MVGPWATSLAFVAVAGAVTVIALVRHRAESLGPGVATMAGNRWVCGEGLWPR